jgi:Fur family transcriptional regulator, peroxide stress response regulator
METYPLDPQALRHVLEAAGLRPTPQRLAVYNQLADSPLHPTAEEVFRSVRKAMPRISLATVYKALEALVQVGVATKLTATSGTSRSRYDARRDPHYHFRCLRTGAVFDLPTQFDIELVDKLDPRLTDFLNNQGFEITGYRLELVGYHHGNRAGELASESMLGEAPFMAGDAPKQ